MSTHRTFSPDFNRSIRTREKRALGFVEGLDFRHNDVLDFIKNAPKNIDHPVSSSRPLAGDASLQEVRGSSQWSLVPRLNAQHVQPWRWDGLGWLTVARRHPRVQHHWQREQNRKFHMVQNCTNIERKSSTWSDERRLRCDTQMAGSLRKFAVNRKGARIRPAVHHDPGLLLVV